ncbi:MAG: hypothetical protein WCB85_04650 [Candidatus Dormiibacterota bacterium]
MAPAKLISTRLGICPVCGHEARLVAATSDEVLSRCYACGDVTRTPQEIQPAWSAADAVRLQGKAQPAAAEPHTERLAAG